MAISVPSLQTEYPKNLTTYFVRAFSRMAISFRISLSWFLPLIILIAASSRWTWPANVGSRGAFFNAAHPACPMHSAQQKFSTQNQKQDTGVWYHQLLLNCLLGIKKQRYNGDNQDIIQEDAALITVRWDGLNAFFSRLCMFCLLSRGISTSEKETPC